MEPNITTQKKSIIKQLPVHEAQKIAAGQVVERPANIVKELIENSLDAGATQITLYIQDGGKQLIRVVDNGCGMSDTDALLCFNHHATSKITCIEDVSYLTTFGFRGEALSSIASVSTVHLNTKEHDAPHGVRLILTSDTSEKKTTTVSCPTGTDFTITDLFKTVPARKKFLKTRDTEWRQILLLFHAFSLAYRNVHFKLISEDKTVLNCPPVQTVHERLAQLWDHTFAQQMLPIETSEHGATITGSVSNHHYYRYDRNQIYIFVNNRWIKNQALSRALIKGYTNVLPTGRFPAACLFITIDSTQVDINIHPRKEEVQFLHPRRIEANITRAVKEALEKNLSSHLKKNVTLADEPDMFAKKTPFFQPGPYASLSKKQALLPEHEPFAKELTLHKEEPVEKNNTQAAPPAAVAFAQSTIDQPSPHEDTYSTYELIGQFKKTYLLLEKEDGLFLIDQHAAHERILYEQFSKRFETVPTITLLFPHIITLSKHELDILEPHKGLFHAHGISLDIFGRNQIVIEATPVHLKDVSLSQLVKQVISWITEYSDVEPAAFQKVIHEKLRAQMACKAAVKAGDTLTTDQMHQLIKDLASCANRLTCPHGRPTGWFIQLEDIEKKFKRNYK